MSCEIFYQSSVAFLIRLSIFSQYSYDAITVAVNTQLSISQSQSLFQTTDMSK